MNQDTLGEILLNSDITVLQSYCSTSKNRCQDPNFWKRKFQVDRLPLLAPQTTAHGWIKEYLKIQRAITDAQKLMQLFEKELVDNRWVFIFIDFNFNDQVIDLLPSKLKDSLCGLVVTPDMQQEIYISLYDEEAEEVPTLVYLIDGGNVEDMEVDETTIFDVLINVLYYFPNQDIINEENISYKNQI